jgi:hypothetical protein
MRLPFRQSWRLRAIERGLRESDPHLAAMLTIFAKLSAGEIALGIEQVHRHRAANWMRPVLAALAAAVRYLAAAMGWTLGQAARLGAGVWRLAHACPAGSARSSSSPRARGPARPSRRPSAPR